VTRAAQPSPDREPELTGEIIGLIEPTPEATPRMQRHRHHHIRVVEHARPGGPEPGAQWLRQRTTAAVLERMQQIPKGALVAAGAARHFEGRRPRATTIAEQSAVAVREGRERITAALTPRLIDGSDR